MVNRNKELRGDTAISDIKQVNGKDMKRIFDQVDVPDERK